MSSQIIVCDLCGHQYDPEMHLGCQSCPLHSECNLVCCPACGYQTVDTQRSFIVKLSRYLQKFRRSRRFPEKTYEGITLADISPGSQVELVGYDEGFPTDRKEHLQAFGLVRNNPIQVIQQTPVTIIHLDNIELALENDLAKGIRVQHSWVEQTESD
jgi:Fe2+ transport system protein FeoA